MKFAIFIVASFAVLAVSALDGPEVVTPSVSDAVKEDITNAINQLKTKVSEQIELMKTKGETAKVDTLKRFETEITSFQTRVNDYQPKTKTGQIILGKLREALTSLQNRYESDIKAKPQ